MATTTINDMVIHDCDATTDGGGINIHDDSDVSIIDVEIYDCTATTDGGGIATQYVAIIAAENIDIHDCSAGADGGGVCLSGNSSDNDYQFRWSLIRDNSASAASGGVCIKDNASAETRLQHCVISGNTAPSVGGVGHESGTTYAVNCTIADNDDDGINSDSGTVYATNCIIWGNDTQVSVTGSGTAYVTSSNVQGGYGGLETSAEHRFSRSAESTTTLSTGSALLSTPETQAPRTTLACTYSADQNMTIRT